ncbi:MAG: HAD family hydrolase [Candidatus Hydrogenedentes bacterium]|nr:HAD family hydrolase [Candidatus Hydrogenedentota bacterium]
MEVARGAEEQHPVRRPALFLDRDGTINGDRPDYVKSLAEFHFLPGAFAAMKRLAALDLPLIVVTNQSQIGQGITPEHVIREINDYLVREIEAHGGRITDIYVCPHAPWEGCGCRKPKPGLLLRASEEHHIDLSRSYMVGDRVSDVAAAMAAGCRCVFISPGMSPPAEVVSMNPEVIVRDLGEASEYLEQVIGSMSL